MGMFSFPPPSLEIKDVTTHIRKIALYKNGELLGRITNEMGNRFYYVAKENSTRNLFTYVYPHLHEEELQLILNKLKELNAEKPNSGMD